MAGEDKFWEHVIRSEGNSKRFKCKYCPKEWECGSVTRIKYHLAKVAGGCVAPCKGTGLPDSVRQEAFEAIQNLKTYKKRYANIEAPVDGNIEAPADGNTEGPATSAVVPRLRNEGVISSALFQIQGWVMTVMNDREFIPQFPTFTYYYLKEHVLFETNSCQIPKVLMNIIQKSHPKFKTLVLSYIHMKTLISKRQTLESPYFSAQCEVIDDIVGSIRYRDLVDFLIHNPDFWSDGDTFVRSFEPLLSLIANLAISGCSIGNIWRAVEAAKTTLKDRYIGTATFEREFAMAGHQLAKTAALLDPSFQCSPDFDELDASQLLKNFSDLYVLQDDKEGFDKGVKMYLDKSDALFQTSASKEKNNSHPSVWWHCYGHPAEHLRQYAYNLVSLPFSGDMLASDVDWTGLLTQPLPLEPSHNFLHRYESADVDLFTAWVLHEEASTAGFQSSWEELKRIVDGRWSLLPDCEYHHFCYNVILALSNGKK